MSFGHYVLKRIVHFHELRHWKNRKSAILLYFLFFLEASPFFLSGCGARDHKKAEGKKKRQDSRVPRILLSGSEKDRRCLVTLNTAEVFLGGGG